MLGKLELLQVFDDKAAHAGHRAISFAASLAQQSGATVCSTNRSKVGDGFGFYSAAEAPIIQQSPDDWTVSAPKGVVRVRLECPSGIESRALRPEDQIVRISLAPWETEETLFAHSGIAEFLATRIGNRSFRLAIWVPILSDMRRPQLSYRSGQRWFASRSRNQQISTGVTC